MMRVKINNFNQLKQDPFETDFMTAVRGWLAEGEFLVPKFKVRMENGMRLTANSLLTYNFFD